MRSHRAPIAVLLLALSSTLAAADVLFTTAVSVEAAGAAKQESREKVWLGPGRLRHDGEEATQIILAAEKRAYFVDHQEKTYSTLELPVDLGKLVPASERPMLDQMTAAMKMGVEITPTDERKKIGSWNARKFAVTLANAAGMKVDVTMWTTTDLKADVASYKRFLRDVSSMFPGAGELAAEMTKVDGISVLTEMSFPGTAFRRRQELLSAEEIDPPAGTYDPPAAYREIPFNPLAKMQPQMPKP